MSLPIALSIPARDDFVEAGLWYEDQRRGWSAQFEHRLDAAFLAITERPASFPVIRGDVRRALLDQFPYAIYFRVMPDHILVIAILHTARAANVLRSRT